MLTKKPLACLQILMLLVACKNSNTPGNYSGWANYAGTKDGIRYSSNNQINTANVSGLKEAWRYSSHDKDTGSRTQIQCNPIMVDGILYGVTPQVKLFALNAATGSQQWLFNPATEDTAAKDPTAFYKVTRGVTYWQDENGANKRIFYGVGNREYCIDATSGTPVRSFGKKGFIDLAEGLDREPGFNTYIAATTPGIVYKDVLIVGMRVAESIDAAAGHIRGYDVKTGQQKWIFHTIPYPGEKGYETWADKEAYKKFGGANNWAGMSLDEKRGIVYVPTGSVGGDFYGGLRKGSNLYANSLLALDAATGKYIWHYQAVHHDIWDRDLAANPNLVTLNHNGQKIDAVAQITKHGFIFLFDRTNGQPIFKIEERKVSTVEVLPGEEAWPTQPFPTLPQPFARQKFDSADVTDISPEAHTEMMEKFKKVKYGAMFTPPNKDGVWIFPGFDGGGEWGGSAVDPETGILYVNSSELPWSLTMIDVPKNTNDKSLGGVGRSVYNRYCITCHGPELKGNVPSFPSLVNLHKRLNEDQVSKVIENGRGRMPAFKQLPSNEKTALLAFLLQTKLKEEADIMPKPGANITVSVSQQLLQQVPYTMTGYNRFLDKNGYPGIKPPWGTLNAVDLNSGKLLWKVPLGEYPELTKKGIAPTGTENYGGPLVTKGGLVFIAASKDAMIRAFDKSTGKILWQAPLPVPGFATPATYTIDGKQFVVIACGGGKIGAKSGDEYIAYALP